MGETPTCSCGWGTDIVGGTTESIGGDDTEGVPVNCAVARRAHETARLAKTPLSSEYSPLTHKNSCAILSPVLLKFFILWLRVWLEEHG